MLPTRILQVAVSILTAIFVVSSVRVASAEPALNQVLSSATLLKQDANGCPVVRIGFNFRVAYVTHFPAKGGRELRIKVKPLSRSGARRNMIVPRESVRPPTSSGNRIRAIDFETNGSGPLLMVYFTEAVNYKVRQGRDFASIEVTVASIDASRRCRLSLADLAPTTNTGSRAKRNTAKSDGSGRPSSEELRSVMQRARRAIAQKEYRKAAQLLTKLTTYPEHKFSADAQELLGVVRERNRQFAHAKAEYEIFLKKYPSSKGASRVRQRLAAIATAQESPRGRLRKAGSRPSSQDRKRASPAGDLAENNRKKSTADAKKSAQSRSSQIPDGGPERTDRTARTAEDTDDPTAYETEFGGSFSQFYYYNEGTTRLTELESRRKTIDDDTFQNSLLSSLDLFATAENNAHRFKFRFSGSYEKDFLDSRRGDQVRVTAAYAELEMKEQAAKIRVGRQTRNEGGIYGRFDGGLLSLQPRENTTLSFAAGSPVDRSRDEPFADDRWFYAASVEFQDVYKGLDVSLYALEQRVESFIDRRAVGIEAQYLDDRRSLYASVDYDFYFDRLNRALISGSYIFEDGSSFSARADYVHSPTLSLRDALQGQTVDTIGQLRNTFSEGQIRELAIDRVTRSSSLNVTYSRPLNDVWQATLDGTIFHTSGNPASGGVPAVESPGTEFFASAQLVGVGVIRPNDILSATLRYANTYSSDLFLLDAYARFPINEKWRIRPRIKIGHRDLKRIDGSEIFVIPSITANYELTKRKSFEIELGGRWSSRDTDLTKEQNQEFYIFAGYRYEF